MPFIDEDKLAALYKEVDQEKKAATYFQLLYQQRKDSMQFYRFYRVGFFVLLFLLLLGAGVLRWGVGSFGKNDKSSELLLQQIDQLKLENKILSGPAKNIQSTLRETTVYTVQFGAFSKKDILLFSDQFVNFRAYPALDFYAYSLGNFATEEEAELFRQELLNLGLRDVWVTSYKMDKRILLNSDDR